MERTIERMTDAWPGIGTGCRLVLVAVVVGATTLVGGCVAVAAGAGAGVGYAVGHEAGEDED